MQICGVNRWSRCVSPAVCVEFGASWGLHTPARGAAGTPAHTTRSPAGVAGLLIFFVFVMPDLCCVWAVLPCGEQGLLWLWCKPWRWLLLSQSTGSRCAGSVTAAPWQVGSSWPRDQTCVTCAGRQILYPWTTREGLASDFKRRQKSRLSSELFLSRRDREWTMLSSGHTGTK